MLAQQSPRPVHLDAPNIGLRSARPASVMRGSPSRSLSLRLAATALALAATWAPAGADALAPGQDPEPGHTVEPSDPLGTPPLFGGEDDPISPRLESVESQSPTLTAALGEYEATRSKLIILSRRLEELLTRLDLLRSSGLSVASALEATRAREREEATNESRSRSVLLAMAIDELTADEGDQLELLQVDDSIKAHRATSLTAAVEQRETLELRRAQRSRREARDRVAHSASKLKELRVQQRASQSERRIAQLEAFLLTVELGEQRAEVIRARAESTVSGLDFQMVALDAYVLAADEINSERPSCQLDWTVLAGIGRVESRHGQYRGSQVDFEGSVTPAIIGVTLSGEDGQPWPDSDGGRFDGDAGADHAVGPMQFIPSSWRIYGRDGNGDGIEEPNNYYDAAMAAADHLCRRHSGLANEVNLRAALFGYNQSVPYGEQVLGHARRYSAAALPLLPEGANGD